MRATMILQVPSLCCSAHVRYIPVSLPRIDALIADMPAGAHEVLDQTREAVERRARILLAQLQELGDDPVKAVSKEETAVAKEECSNLR